MASHKFIRGRPYFQAGFASHDNAIWSDKFRSTPIVTTWVYAGTVEDLDPALSCDLPRDHLVFQPFIPFNNVLERPPTEGLRLPSLQTAELSMLTLDELIETLTELRDQMKDQSG